MGRLVAGVLAQQRWMVTAFFSSSAVALVGTFHLFVDVCTDINIRYSLQTGSFLHVYAGANVICDTEQKVCSSP